MEASGGRNQYALDKAPNAVERMLGASPATEAVATEETMKIMNVP